MLILKNKELQTNLNNAIALFKELETPCPDAIKSSDCILNDGESEYELL